MRLGVGLSLRSVISLWIVSLTPAYAQAIVWNGEEFPAQVDLSDQLNPDDGKDFRVQSGGSCHVYAGATLAEMHCQRRAGARVHFSREFLFAQHLRDEARASPSLDWISFLDFPAALASGKFTSLDGGLAEDTITRIAAGNVIQDKDGSFARGFFPLLEELSTPFGISNWTRSPGYSKNPTRSLYSYYFADRLDRFMRDAVHAPLDERDAPFGDYRTSEARDDS